MKIASCLITVAFITMSSAAMADSCLIRMSKTDSKQVQCQEFGPAMEEVLGSGKTLGQMGCEGLNNTKIDQAGNTLNSEFRKGKSCPGENVVLRCGTTKTDGQYDQIIYFYKGATYPNTPAQLCKSMQGEVL